MQYRQDVLQRVEARKLELEKTRKHYSVKNPRFFRFARKIAFGLRKRVEEVQRALDFKVQLREIGIVRLENCLVLNDIGVRKLLEKERIEGEKARRMWNRASKPVFDNAVRFLNKTPKFLFDSEKHSGYDLALEFERDSFNRLSFQIERDLEWVLNGK